MATYDLCKYLIVQKIQFETHLLKIDFFVLRWPLMSESRIRVTNWSTMLIRMVFPLKSIPGNHI